MAGQKAVQNPTTGKWESPKTTVTVTKEESSTGKAYVQPSKTTWVSQDKSSPYYGQEVYQSASGTVLPTSITLSEGMTSADVARQYGLTTEQQAEVSKAIVAGRIEQSSAMQIAAAQQQQKPSVGLTISGAGAGLPGSGVGSVVGLPGVFGERQTPSQIAKASIPSPEISVLYRAPIPEVGKFPVTPGYETNIGGIQEPTYSMTTKNGAKTPIIIVPESIAKLDYSKLGLWGKIDVQFAHGKLWGGVTPLESNFLYGTLTDKDRKLLKQRKIGLGIMTAGAFAVPVAATAIAATPYLITSGSIFLGGKTLWTVAKSIGLTTTVAAGTYYAAETIRKHPISPTYGYSDIYGNKQIMADVNKAVGYSRQTVRETQKPFSERGFRENIIDYVGYNLPFFKNVEGATGGRAKTYEMSTREYLSWLGYKGSQLDKMVAVAQAERVGKRSSEAAGFIAAGVSSEIYGHKLVKQAGADLALKGISMKTIPGKLEFIKEATKGVAIAGAGEGAATSVVFERGGTQKFTLKHNPVTWAVGGALVAGTIGGKIVQLSAPIGGQPIKSKLLLGSVYATDYGEFISDKIAGFGMYMAGQTTRGGVKVNVAPVIPTISGMFGGGRKKPKAQTARFTEIKQPRAETPKDVASITSSEAYEMVISKPKSIAMNLPDILSTSITKTAPSIRVPTSRGRGVTNILGMASVPISPMIITPPYTPIPVKPTTKIPVNIIVGLPVPVNVPIGINTPVDTPVNVPIDVPIIVPTWKAPFFIPGGGGAGRGWNFGRRSRVKTKYTPSLVATTFGITGKQPTGLSGLEIRPISGRKKNVPKKKKKYDVMNFKSSVGF